MTESNKQQDMHRADIVASVRKAGTTLARLSVEAGLHPRTLNNALERKYPKGEQIIAKAIGKTPQEIWPSRYA